MGLCCAPRICCSYTSALAEYLRRRAPQAWILVWVDDFIWSCINKLIGEQISALFREIFLLAGFVVSTTKCVFEPAHEMIGLGYNLRVDRKTGHIFLSISKDRWIRLGSVLTLLQLDANRGKPMDTTPRVLAKFAGMLTSSELVLGPSTLLRLRGIFDMVNTGTAGHGPGRQLEILGQNFPCSVSRRRREGT